MRINKYTGREHAAIVELLPLYVNNSIDAENRVRVDTHLESCSDCRQELAFERRLQQAVAVELNVSKVAMRNLAKFNVMLDEAQAGAHDYRHVAEKNLVSGSESQADKPGFDLIQRLKEIFRDSIVGPTGQLTGPFGGPFKGMLALGLVAAVAVGALYQSTRDAANPSGGQYSGNVVRSCKPSDEIQQYEFSITAIDREPTSIEALEMLLADAFPDTHYTVVPQQDTTLVTVDGTVCDKRIPKVTRSLEEHESIRSVTVRGLSND